MLGIQHNIPEDLNVQKYCCKNLASSGLAIHSSVVSTDWITQWFRPLLILNAVSSTGQPKERLFSSNNIYLLNHLREFLSFILAQSLIILH
jgi:hypothetical protein